MLGPQADRFTDEGIAAFLGAALRMLPQSDRMGARLRGPAHRARARPRHHLRRHRARLVQVPGDGQPIVLLVDRQSTGGYTKIATVGSFDIGRIGQVKPGQRVRFRAIDVAEAHRLRAGPGSRPSIAPDEGGSCDESGQGSQRVRVEDRSFARAPRGSAWRSCRAATAARRPSSIRTRSISSAARAPTSGTSTGPSAWTSTATTRAWCSATRTPDVVKAVQAVGRVGAVVPGPDRARDPPGRDAGPPGAVGREPALHELRHRGDDERRAAGPRVHRPAQARQVRGRLPRHPRLGDGERERRHQVVGQPPPAQADRVVGRDSAGGAQEHGRAAVERPRGVRGDPGQGGARRSPR